MPLFSFTIIIVLAILLVSAYNLKTMIPNTTKTFLLRLLALWILLLAVTAVDDEYNDDSAAAPTFLRRVLQQKCNKKACPAETPTPGGSCCYTDNADCNYRYTYLWDSSCQTISCIPVVECQCIPDPIKGKKKSTWQCLSLSIFQCLVTDSTPFSANMLASSVGMPCTPA